VDKSGHLALVNAGGEEIVSKEVGEEMGTGEMRDKRRRHNSRC